MRQCVWWSWSLPRTDSRLRPMPALLVRAACSPLPGRYSWGRRCSSGVRYPWRCWWPGAVGTGTRSHRFLCTGFLRHKTHGKGSALETWDSAAAVHACIDKHSGLLSRSMRVQWSAQEFILPRFSHSQSSRHIRRFKSWRNWNASWDKEIDGNGDESINEKIYSNRSLQSIRKSFWITVLEERLIVWKSCSALLLKADHLDGFSFSPGSYVEH